MKHLTAARFGSVLGGLVLILFAESSWLTNWFA